ncbi:hypothetical protein ACOCHN_29515 [Klebsiella pneumoniae]|nr:hypothetical protein [Klebsiella pneumoniae]MCY0629499.1 hypothetical protein [Klebsiella pneumoniae]
MASRRRRRFLNRLIRSLATPAGRLKITAELRRRIRYNKYWVNEANRFGLETLCELLLAILDDLDFRDWQTRHNLETLAERAGLATRSQSGHVSISRASRGCDRLVWLNAIITEKAPSILMTPAVPVSTSRSQKISLPFSAFRSSRFTGSAHGC